jgi:hypothetical protein
MDNLVLYSNNELSKELIRVLDGIHEPCQRHLINAVDKAVSEIKKELNELQDKTKILRKWNLIEEQRHKDTNTYPSASGVAITNKGIGFLPSCKLHVILNFDRVNGEPSDDIDTYYGGYNDFISGFVKASYEPDNEDLIKVICGSEKLKFEKWAEKTKYVPFVGDWGFLAIFDNNDPDNFIFNSSR